MHRPLRRLLALVVTVLVATGVTVAAYLHGRAEVERLSHGTAGDEIVVPAKQEAVPPASIQVRAEEPVPGERRAG